MKKKHFRPLALLLCLLLLAGCAPKNVTEDPAAADFTYEAGENGIVLTSYTGHAAELTIPQQIKGQNVVAIGESCFAGNIFLEKVQVPEGVTALGDYAFECCSVLKKVRLPSSLLTIGDGAFSGCVSLYLLDVQDEVRSIGKGAFLECRALVSFVAPKALESVGSFAFANCTDLAKADMKESALQAVPDRMFYACRQLSSVLLPEGLGSIGKRAFCQNEKLTYIYVPDTVTEIGSYAFERCTGLQSFYFPCREVAPFTFYCCDSLTYVDLPQTLTKIGSGAFREAGVAAAELEIPAGCTVAEDAFTPMPDDEVIDDTPQEEPEKPAAQIADITAAELAARAAEKGYRSVSREEFPAWSEAYLAFNKDNALLSDVLNPYISKYKTGIGDYYVPMTAVASGVASEIEAAKVEFGDDFEEMYRMINHGLSTEMHRFRMEEDMLLYTGVYDFQLTNITGGSTVPTPDELKKCIGKTFTDPCLTSTSTEAEVAFGFSNTVFVIYAPAAAMDDVGTVCMDSYMGTVENEILLYSGATYEILDVGVMENGVDENGDPDVRTYLLLQLLRQ